jgi:hypothetical protein
MVEKQLWPNLSGVQLLHHPDLMPVWWSLALGACLGGNGSVIGRYPPDSGPTIFLYSLQK